jgi:hypothetical protein
VQTANEKSKMVVNCKKMWARLPESGVSLRNRWQRILDRLAHLLRRAIWYAASAMLDSDFEYFLLHHAINCFIP